MELRNRVKIYNRIELRNLIEPCNREGPTARSITAWAQPQVDVTPMAEGCKPDPTCDES
jgi:hypothetical protein